MGGRMKRSRGAIVLIIGLIGFMNVARNPRFETFHTVDILQLIVSGMCFGVALMVILGRAGVRRT